MKTLVILLLLISIGALVYTWLVHRAFRRAAASQSHLPVPGWRLVLPSPTGLSRRRQWPAAGFWVALVVGAGCLIVLLGATGAES